MRPLFTGVIEDGVQKGKLPHSIYNVAQVWMSRLICENSSIVTQSLAELAWLDIKGEGCWQHALSWLTEVEKKNGG